MKTRFLLSVFPLIACAAVSASAQEAAPAEDPAPAQEPAAEAAAPAEAGRPALAGECAALVLRGAGDARWIFADGSLAAALDRAARESGNDVVVLPMIAGNEEALDRAEEAAASIPSADVRNALRFGVAPFLRTWLAEDPEGACAAVAVAGLPAVAENSGFAAVPSGLCYRIVPVDAATNGLAEAAAAFSAARDELGELFSADMKASFSPEAAPFRALAGQAGDRLGCLLWNAGDTNAALDAFLAADSVYPPGCSAALNAASLVRRGARPAVAASVAHRLEAVVRGGERWSLYAEGGPVAVPEDFFETGWYWTVSGLSPFAAGTDGSLKAALEAIPEADRPLAAARLRQAVRPLSLLVAPGPVPAADAPVGALVGAADALFYRGERVRADRLLRKAAFDAPAERALAVISRARLLATGGETAKAVSALEEALASAKAEPMEDLDVSEREIYLRALAETAVEALDVGAARMRFLALVEEKGLCADWAAKCSAAIGALAQGDAPRANAFLVQAVGTAEASQPPHFPPNWAPLRLRAFVALQSGDLPGAAEAAAALLEARGGHDFFGHYVLGLAANAEGDAAKTDFHFQSSLAERAVWFVLNDFAAALDARGAPRAAVGFARQAVAAGGAEQAAVQDTLGMALLHAGESAEALETMRKAAELPGGGMPAIRLDLAEALSENGEFDELATVLKQLEPALAVADEETRKRAATLRENLAAQGESAD